jgi:formamidopyrimidine-DNA glycosylase
VPELPEVETVVRTITPQIKGRSVAGLVLQPGASRTLQGQLAKVNASIKGRKVLDVSRRAKYILIRFDKEGSGLSIHLRMTGRLYLEGVASERPQYVRARLKFSSGKALCFEDTRRFGKIKYWTDLHELDQNLGVEPLGQDFSVERCSEIIKGKKRALKVLLLDQKLIAGLGNIYVDEVLWRAKLHPLRKANTLKLHQIAELTKAIKKVLKTAIQNEGTTFDSFYFGDGETGKYVNLLKVFDRTGQPCSRCKTPITKIRIAQRGTHLCLNCQT